MTVTHSSLTWAHTVAMMSLDISLLNSPPPQISRPVCLAAHLMHPLRAPQHISHQHHPYYQPPHLSRWSFHS